MCDLSEDFRVFNTCRDENAKLISVSGKGKFPFVLFPLIGGWQICYIPECFLWTAIIPTLRGGKYLMKPDLGRSC